MMKACPLPVSAMKAIPSTHLMRASILLLLEGVAIGVVLMGKISPPPDHSNLASLTALLWALTSRGFMA
jgi:hypothetical protein